MVQNLVEYQIIIQFDSGILEKSLKISEKVF